MAQYVPRLVTNLQQDHWYYQARCRKNAGVVVIEEDESRGKRPYLAGRHIVSCWLCRGAHEYDSSEIISRRWE